MTGRFDRVARLARITCGWALLAFTAGHGCSSSNPGRDAGDRGQFVDGGDGQSHVPDGLACPASDGSSDNDPCSVVTCSPGAGIQRSPRPNGTPCDDQTVCNGRETCQAGQCVVAMAPVVDDGDPCTLDLCDAITGPVHVAIPRCPNKPPAIEPIADRRMAKETTLSVAVKATDDDGDRIALTLPALPAFGKLTDHGDGTAEIVFTPSPADTGKYPLVVVANDGRDQTR